MRLLSEKHVGLILFRPVSNEIQSQYRLPPRGDKSDEAMRSHEAAHVVRKQEHYVLIVKQWDHLKPKLKK